MNIATILTVYRTPGLQFAGGRLRSPILGFWPGRMRARNRWRSFLANPALLIFCAAQGDQIDMCSKALATVQRISLVRTLPGNFLMYKILPGSLMDWPMLYCKSGLDQGLSS